jgi:hypothetical protein
MNSMIAKHRERESTEQPRIDVALQTIVTEEMEQLSRERQQWKQTRPAKAREKSELTSTAVELAEIRAGREKASMVQRLRQGAKEAYRRDKREQREKREREESKKLAALQPKKKKVGRKYKSTKAAEIRQEIVKPHTQVLIDRIFRARRPKFRTDVAESTDPQVERDLPRPPTFTSLARCEISSTNDADDFVPVKGDSETRSQHCSTSPGFLQLDVYPTAGTTEATTVPKALSRLIAKYQESHRGRAGLLGVKPTTNQKAAGSEKCPWAMPAFSPAWTLARLSLQDKDNLHNL